jgi:hypothetical protein
VNGRRLAALLTGAALVLAAPAAAEPLIPDTSPAVVGSPTAEATVAPPVDWRPLPTLAARTPIASSEHFRVFVDPAGDVRLEAVARRWAPRLEAILAADERRFGRDLASIVDVAFSPAYDARCPARGLASPASDPPLIVVYVPEDVMERYMSGVLAHEIGHHLTAGEDFVSDGILSEGLANWIAGPPMLAWMGLESWDSAVRAALAGGTYLSLTQPDVLSPLPAESCIARRDVVYALRTSFVGWMIRTYGLDTVRAMPYSEKRATDAMGTESITREPDYAAATGHSLRELERLWLEDVLVAGGVNTLQVRGWLTAPGASRHA